MYKRVETDREIKLVNNEKVNPVATLADRGGGRIQIVVDDYCYVLYLKITNPLYKNMYKPTLYISKEVLEVLKILPSPE